MSIPEKHFNNYWTSAHFSYLKYEFLGRKILSQQLSSLRMWKICNHDSNYSRASNLPRRIHTYCDIDTLNRVTRVCLLHYSKPRLNGDHSVLRALLKQRRIRCIWNWFRPPMSNLLENFKWTVVDVSMDGLIIRSVSRVNGSEYYKPDEFSCQKILLHACS